MNKRIKLFEDIGGHKAGAVLTVDEEKARRYVAAGVAADAPATDLGGDGASLADAIRGDIKALVRDMATAAADATKAGPGRPEVRIEGVTPELKGYDVFGSAGGFLHAVKAGTASSPDRDSVEKLAAWADMQRKCGVGADGDFINKAPSGQFEASDPDGGALVIPEFSQTIVERLFATENFLSESDTIVVRGNTMTFPALDDKSRLDGARSGGVLGAWADEAMLLSNVSKIQFRQMVLRLKKLYVFAYMTEELLSDSPYALEQYMARKVAEEIAFKTNDGLIRGTGSGQPMGALKAPCKIAVDKEAGQAAKTILNANIENMWMRFNAACRQNATWYINQDCEKQLQLMALPIGIAGVPTYMPVGGVSNPSFATLKGRPVKPIEFCETLGTEGDIILVDWSKWQSIVKGGIKTDMSMHVRFQYGEMAYRFTYRIDSQPKWDAPITPYKGSNTTSPIVTLAVRA